MRDLTIHDRTIRREGLRQSDFKKYPELVDDSNLDRLILKTEKIARGGFISLNLSKAEFNGKTTYKIKNIEDELVLRLVAKNIKRLTKVRQANRTSIIQAILRLLEEGVDAQIYKLDVKSFYENVSKKHILYKLEKDTGFSKSTQKLLESFFNQLQQQGIYGLPRGLSISATLAEYIMRDFDNLIENSNDVFFYARFVDDIIIVAKPKKSSKKYILELNKKLPSGLNFNSKKVKILLLNENLLRSTQQPKIAGALDFLGYRFTIYARMRNADNSPIFRRVDCDISPSKMNKIKTKIYLSFLEFTKDGNFPKLYERLKLLSGNYTVYDHGRDVKRKAGIYYSYSAIDAENSISLKKLDDYVKRLVLSKDGKLCSNLNQSLSNTQRRKILKISFEGGFKKKVFYNFSGSRLVELMDCWKYA